MKPRKAWLAALLSFLAPGLGQFYAGYLYRGIVFLSALIFLAIFANVITYTFFLFSIFLILIISTILFNMIDAFFITKKTKKYPPPQLDKWYFYLLIALIWSFFILEGLKMYVSPNLPLKSFYVPTPAMEPTVMVGDYIRSSKISPKNVQRRDVLIFHYPKNRKTSIIKRCVGLPGDTLEVINGLVYINGQLTEDSTKLQFSYLLQTKFEITSRAVEKFNLDQYFSTEMMEKIGKNVYLIYTQPSKANSLSQLPIVEYIERDSYLKGDKNEHIYPKSIYFNWNEDFYGPFIIPKKGWTVELDTSNYALYYPLMPPSKRDQETYTFTKDYYFMMGDNRDNSLDSRYLGFVPENLIKAKILYIVWSEDWERLGLKP